MEVTNYSSVEGSIKVRQYYSSVLLLQSSECISHYLSDKGDDPFFGEFVRHLVKGCFLHEQLFLRKKQKLQALLLIAAHISCHQVISSFVSAWSVTDHRKNVGRTNDR